MAEKRGIDVSYAQGNIDFDKIKSDEVKFAIVRSSYGWQSGQKDSKFDRNIQGFQSKKIPCGAHHYSYAKSVSDALKEAKYCLSCIKGYNLELPVFYDLENSSTAQTGKRTCTDIAKTFCDYITKAGYRAGIYMNPNWLENYVYKDELIGKYELWLAQWNAAKPSYNCSFWQYKVGNSGTISGIDGDVCLDYMLTADDEDAEQEDKEESKEDTEDKNVQSEKPEKPEFQVGDTVKVINPVDCDSGRKLTIYPNDIYKVIEVSGSRIVIGISGKVTAAVDAKNLEKVVRQKKTYTYIVRAGDTLSSIAAKYDTTYQEIAAQNNIKNPNLIYGGQILHITV